MGIFDSAQLGFVWTRSGYGLAVDPVLTSRGQLGKSANGLLSNSLDYELNSEPSLSYEPPVHPHAAVVLRSSLVI